MVSVVGVVIAVTSLRTKENFEYSSLKPSEQELTMMLKAMNNNILDNFSLV